MGRRTLLLIASILVAALGTALVWLYVQGAESRAQQNTALVQVLFAGAGAGPGATIEQTRPFGGSVSAEVAGKAVRSTQEVIGKHLADGVVAGEMLVAGMFTTGVSSAVSPHQAYVAITITDPHRVPALLKQGDTVAVYALGQSGSAGARGASLVADGIKVQTIGSSSQPGSNGAQVPVTIVGFSVPPRTAYDLINIETYGQPVLVLLGEGAQAYRP
jgi:pilus assembly protein CpaB